MTRPHNCRHCSFMVCGDANWCDEHKEVMSDAQISVARKCPEWEWNELDALTLEEWVPKPEKKSLAQDEQMSLDVGK